MAITAARTTLGSGVTSTTKAPSVTRAASVRSSRLAPSREAIAQPATTTTAQFAPETAVRWVSDAVRMSSSRSAGRAVVSPVASPGRSPATSPPSTPVRARKRDRRTSATAAIPAGDRRSRTSEAVTRVRSPAGSPVPPSARASISSSEPTAILPPGSARNTRTGAAVRAPPTERATASNQTPPVASGRAAVSTPTSISTLVRSSAARTSGSGCRSGAERTTAVIARAAPASETATTARTARRSRTVASTTRTTAAHAVRTIPAPLPRTTEIGSSPHETEAVHVARAIGASRRSAALTAPPRRGRPRGSSRRSPAPRAADRRS